MTQICINNLSKSYGKNKVLDNVDLVLTNERLNFLIGANGSGKTTFLKCLLKLIKYQGRIAGNDVAIAYMPERLPLPDYVSAQDFLLLIGAVRGESRAELLVKLHKYFIKFQLLAHRSKRLAELSKGMKQKVLLIQALMMEADIYIFDEPLNGLDTAAREAFFQEITQLRRQKKLIIITTHELHQYRFRNKRVIDFRERAGLFQNEIDATAL